MGNIKIAKICGLCYGCKNAIQTTQELLRTKKDVTLYKQIVHNKNINNMLTTLGAKFAFDLNQIPKDSHVVLRAHGEPQKTYEYLQSNNIAFSDCTCPNVANIHKLVQKYCSLGYDVAIVGKHGKISGIIHPEVEGTLGHVSTGAITIEDLDDIQKFEEIKNKKIYLVCQTTFNKTKAQKLIENIENICKKNNNQLVVNFSICNAQQNISDCAINLAKQCDVMVVVGGKNSSNTQELFSNVSKITKSVFLEDVNTWQKVFTENNIVITPTLKIGITAGASTLTSELKFLKQKIQEKVKTNN